MTHSNKPLQGITILDCSVLLPGPFIGKLLVDKGARVIKLENPDRPDPARDLGAGGFYEHLNSEKELVWINLTSVEGKEKFRKLVGQAHGLIESFRPSAKLKLGLDEKSLHSINPKLCIASLVGYPEDSPNRDRAGHDLNFQAVSGALSLFKEMPGLPLSELVSGYEGALSLISAIQAVLRGGEATRSTISISESLKVAQGRFVREAKKSGELPFPGNTLLTGRYPCYNIYSALDGGRFAMAAMEEKFWFSVCDLLGVPELKANRFAEGQDGKRVHEQIQSIIGAKSSTHWRPLFAGVDCCVEFVSDYTEIFGIQNGVAK